MKPSLHSIGRVAGKHGFSGEISLILVDSADRKAIKKGNFIFVEFDGKGVPFLIESCKANATVVKLTDVDNMEEAAELEGKTIYSTLKPLSNLDSPNLEIAGFDLYQNQVKLGTIINVEEYPAGLMLVVEIEQNQVLIPLVESWILSVSPESRMIEMNLPDGLIEL